MRPEWALLYAPCWEKCETDWLAWLAPLAQVRRREKGALGWWACSQVLRCEAVGVVDARL